MKKDTNLLNGKGENEIVSWITVNGAHIPIKKGENKKEVIEKRFKQQTRLEREIKQLLEWQHDIPDDILNRPSQPRYVFTPDEKIPSEKLKEISRHLQSLEPITLDVRGRKITAKFDRYGADKNIFYKGETPDIIAGYYCKLNHIDDIPQIIKASRFVGDSKEKGKDTKAHRGVKMWYYFKTQIGTAEGNFDVLINVREKEENQYFYDLAYAKKS